LPGEVAGLIKAQHIAGMDKWKTGYNEPVFKTSNKFKFKDSKNFKKKHDIVNDLFYL
jgi:hypothetical protein